MENIQEIIDSKNLKIHLEPILSLRGRSIFGIGALVRGVKKDGTLISPAWLFCEASKVDLVKLQSQQMMLDRHHY